MSDLLRRIKRPRRTPAADPARGFAASPHAEAPLEASPGVGGPVLAGEDLADQRPTALRRGRLRKRLRFLERARELLLRDLGGLVYEIHRSGTAGDREHHRTLVAEKVTRLNTLDAELESGLAALGEARGDTVLREPGIGGMCPRCGEIHGSDARFCSACGFPLEVTATPGAAAHARGAAAGDAIVPAPVSATHVAGGPAPGAGGATPTTGRPIATAPARQSPAGTGNPSSPIADPATEAAAPAFEDAPTQISPRRSHASAAGDDTGELPPPASEPR